MADISILLDRYVSLSMGTVQGYLTPLDARLISALLTYQKQNGINGHLCEIGVHHGRLLLMLAMARRSGERALGIDLFEDDMINIGCRQRGRDQALFVNARRLGISLSEEETFMTSSLDIGPPAILDRTTGPIRFWSIDGGHFYHHVENDLRLAEATVVPKGIIAVDDFFNPRWPEVSLAVYDFLRKTHSIVPFAITRGKIYLSYSGAAEKYKAALRLHTE
ncbi:MAG: class I SAM-dependent methyltransferase, partial [Limisphaerales bacterium]